ncbi:hypothetical protein EIN_170840 [Entamoeba invadens IP1]|uniref:Uncharacterized protein n=1 Tax=Entamoeba invadens IP1 TaxID=370355 RepID=A0A0A1TVN8_ENTIV|nr:hypothetical protein EIN_170840 [Entamoeba invadens IP1]ELP84549.1 hypothetical protein EIN_170840 [Entamoeba invadens IP1]|eukprot:XP_004183895.1 hypothetical protein EIN_170840 [Entamoeba invadens IP1]
MSREAHSFQSRSKRAISTAMLIYHFLWEEGRITFKKSKQSTYALKVLIGKEAILKDRVFSPDHMEFLSNTFCRKMNILIQKARKTKASQLSVNFNKLSSVKDEVRNNDNKPKTMITVCRNREAAFSNFLASVLIERGFTLNLTLITFKNSTSATHLYVWDSVISPHGNTFFPDQHEDTLVGLINQIQKYRKNTTLCKDNFDWGLYTPSAFSPTDKQLYEVLL